MDTTTANIISEVTKKTQSELILFFIIAGVFLVLVLLPLYKMVMDDRKQRRQDELKQRESEEKTDTDRFSRYSEREGRIIQVITQNTEVISGLKVTLDTFSKMTNDSFTRIHDRIDACLDTNKDVLKEIKSVDIKTDMLKSNQDRMLKDLHEISLVVDNIPGVPHKKKEQKEEKEE